jgi:isoleucyl-tRNA synthetase
MAAVDPATADKILEDLKAKGRLFASEMYPHSYPHCWRCKTELLFRLVDEWFIHMGKKPEKDEPAEGFRKAIMDVTEQVTFLPESINGRARELKWLEQMGDWMISKKRFWGLALPIWVDEKTGDFEVIGSRAELKQRAVLGWDEFEGHTPHRPWIDKVAIRNPKTGNLMYRIHDVGNPWLDAGIVPYSTMGYNHDRKYWTQWFPADFITESFPGQFRNWFYAILAMSTMMENRPPFAVLLGHALVRDQHGDTMAKSKGNAIEFNGAANDGYELFTERDPKVGVEQQAKRDLPEGWKSYSEGEVVIDGVRKQVVKGQYPPIGADVIRWLYCRTNPASNINFGPESADELRSKFHLKLWNSYAFFCNYAVLDGFDPAAPQVPVKDRPDIDRWILSDLQQLVATARARFEAFDVMAFCLEAERFVDDKLSNWYIRRNRRRFWKSEKGADKDAAYQTLYQVLVTLAKLLAPVMPFLSETMYQNLVPRAKERGESVHHCDYPQVNAALVDESTALIDEELSADMEAMLRLKELGLAARNRAKVKVRQPLAELKVQPANDRERRAVERFSDQLVDELNVKRVTLHTPSPLDKSTWWLLEPQVKANHARLKDKFGDRLREVLQALEQEELEMVAAHPGASLCTEVKIGDTRYGLDADDFLQWKAPEGWIGVCDKGTQLALDARITEELKLEGMAREVVRHVQQARKDAGLEMDDRIVLYLGTESDKLRQAIEAHRAYIANETLLAEWATQPLGEGAYRAEVQVDGQPLTVELKKRS